MQPTPDLQAAYQRTDLQREGISFDAAMLSPMLTKCLQRIAQASQPINQPPMPKHRTKVQWQAYKD